MDSYNMIYVALINMNTLKTGYMYNEGKDSKGDYRDVVISINGHGAYTYARLGEYLIKVGDNYIDPTKMRIGEFKPNID